MVKSTAGDLLLDGDAPNTIAFHDAVTVQARQVLTLNTASGSMSNSGALTLESGHGIVIQDGLTGASTDPLVLSAGWGTANLGSISVEGPVTSGNGPVTITAWDLNVPGSINAGTSNITILSRTGTQTIGLGSTTKDMQVDDGEIGKLSAAAGLIVGSALNSHITVAGLSVANTDSIGTLTLRSLQPGTSVNFADAASNFDKGIVVQATAGVNIAHDTVTKDHPTLIWAGTGTLTVGLGKSLKTTNQLLTITADDTNIGGPLSSGAALMVVECTTTGRSVGLGSASKEMNIEGTHMIHSSHGVTIGAAGNCGNMTADGSLFPFMQSTLSLMAIADGAMVTFEGGKSIFHDLKVNHEPDCWWSSWMVLHASCMASTWVEMRFDGLQC